MNIYLKAGVITLVIFVLGLSIGIFLVNKKSDIINRDVDRFINKLEESRIYSLYFDVFENREGFCSALKLKLRELAYETDKLGKLVASLEETKGTSLEIKKKYLLSNIELWLNAVNLKEKCPGENISTILYFYSEKSFCLGCKEQALVLDSIKKENPDVWVFALASDIDIVLIDSIMEQFNVNSAPGIVINEKIVFNKVALREEILENLEK